LDVANLMMIRKFKGKKKYEAQWNLLRQCISSMHQVISNLLLILQCVGESELFLKIHLA